MSDAGAGAIQVREEGLGQRRDWLALNFAFTILLSAFLLFQIQPLISKFILPWFGGSPSVWTTCMLFFQVVLFCGYAYAHVLTRFLAPQRQAQVHGALLLVSVLLLRVAPDVHWKPTDAEAPALRILVLLAASVRIYTEPDSSGLRYRSDWMLLARDERSIAAIGTSAPPTAVARAPRLWTDHHSDLFGILQ